MPDTRRTLDAFVNASTGLLRDANNIPAQSVRDALVSVFAGGLEPASAAPTTGDVTGVVGNLYVCDLSGLTAVRNLTLPSATVGEKIGVYVSVAHATHALVLKGAASQTINGGTAEAEWSRVFIKGECVIFMCIAANTWIVESDRRIPQQVIMQRATAKTGIVESADAEVDGYATPTLDNAGIANNTNGRITPRRAGVYCTSFRSRVTAASGANLGTGSTVDLILKVDSANDAQRFDAYTVIPTAGLPNLTCNAVQVISLGSYISAFAFVTDPTQVTTIELGTAVWNYPKITLCERLQ